MGPRKTAEGRQGTVESNSYIKYTISDRELREALNITAPGSITTIAWRYNHQGKEWIITQSVR